MNAQDLAARLIDGHTYEIRTYRNTPGNWRSEPMFVHRHKGQVVTISPRDSDWAEYDPRHCDLIIQDGNLHMAVEDYWMDIKISSIDPNYG